MPSHYQINLGVVWQYRTLLLVGLRLTLELLVVSEVLGLLVGLIAGVGRLSRLRLVSSVCMVYIEVFRGTPLLIQLFWAYYCLPILLNVRLSPVATGLISLTLFAGAYMAEIFRAGIQSVHKGQMLGARALGLSHLQAMRHVILPQAIRRMLPPLVSQSIDVFKMTSLASTISVPELTFQASYATSQTYRFVEFYTVSALIYFVIALPLILYLRQREVPSVGA